MQVRRGSNFVLGGDGNINNYNQRRLMINQSPSNAELGGINGLPIAGAGYFHQRNQSLDVGVLALKQKPVLKNQTVNRKPRLASNNASQGLNDSQIGEYNHVDDNLR